MSESLLPTREQANDILLWAHEQNPGPWLNHSKVVARAAETIARKSGLDSNKAYVSGLLHDIGRYEGVTGLRHIYAGHKLMNEKGFPYNGRICLTHSFPVKDMDSIIGEFDCTEDEVLEIERKIYNYEYDDYDKLIQLCDAICLAEGVCLMEVRLIDVVRRYNVCNQNILSKWKEYFAIKLYFDSKCGMNIYNLFYDEVVRNSIK